MRQNNGVWVEVIAVAVNGSRRMELQKIHGRNNGQEWKLAHYDADGNETLRRVGGAILIDTFVEVASL